jgi:tRNA-modifying protein YgfZ
MGLADDVARLEAGTAFADRADRGFVLVSGPDTYSFLQALVSADLDPLVDGTGTDCLLLQPQGKLDVAFRLLRASGSGPGPSPDAPDAPGTIAGDIAALDCDPGLSAQLAASLLKYRIRVKAEVFDATGELAMLSLLSGDAPAPPVAVPDALHAHVTDGELRFVRTRHGHDVIGPFDAIERYAEQLRAAGVAQADPEAYEAWRIGHGVAVQPFDLDDSTIPQEAFLEVDAVSFTKGCFIGQELVCRIDTRGHVNRFLRTIDVLGDARPEPGAEIVVDDKVVGTVTSVTPDGVAPVALGYVRREVEPPTDVVLRGDDGDIAGRVRAT